ncbi:MAG: endonuclease domain-containing protein [Patescibacteria group bacterium]|nr:endonuclease domain-containing protein [Patescibacteria group bacterium]
MPFLYNNPSKKQLRRYLRRRQTDAERIFWYYLRSRRFYNLKFRRQYGVGRYVVDFCCPALRIAIELDGGYHFQQEIIEYDIHRQKFIEAHGIHVIRFNGSDVFNNIDGILERLRVVCGV